MTRKEEIDEMVRSSVKETARASFRKYSVQFALSDALRDQWLAKSTANSPRGGDDVDGNAGDSSPGEQVSFEDLDAAAAALQLGKPAPVVSSARSQGSQSCFATSTKGRDITPSGSAANSAKEVATVESGAMSVGKPEVPKEAPIVAPARQEKSGDLLEGLHVLVVEDSPVARTMLVRLLKANGCTADEAEDGQQAVDKVRAALAGDELVDVDSSGMSVRGPRSKAYDMILCDSVMPVMDGPTAVKRIREMGYTQAILGVTGNTLPEQKADFLAHGADDVVGKPVRQQVLKDAMKVQLLKKAQLLKDKSMDA
jgi:CheY-like chemotaxis protein